MSDSSCSVLPVTCRSSLLPPSHSQTVSHWSCLSNLDNKSYQLGSACAKVKRLAHLRGKLQQCLLCSERKFRSHTCHLSCTTGALNRNLLTTNGHWLVSYLGKVSTGWYLQWEACSRQLHVQLQSLRSVHLLSAIAGIAITVNCSRLYWARRTESAQARHWGADAAELGPFEVCLSAANLDAEDLAQTQLHSMSGAFKFYKPPAR